MSLNQQPYKPTIAQSQLSMTNRGKLSSISLQEHLLMKANPSAAVLQARASGVKPFKDEPKEESDCAETQIDSGREDSLNNTHMQTDNDIFGRIQLELEQGSLSLEDRILKGTFKPDYLSTMRVPSSKKHK